MGLFLLARNTTILASLPYYHKIWLVASKVWNTSWLKFSQNLYKIKSNSKVQRPRDKVWVDVVPRRDVLVINTGRAMEIISNGRSLATYHRVKFTPNTERISIPFFLAPNKDAQIFPFGVPEKERKYESIEYLVWWNEKMRPTFPEYAQRK